MVLTHSACMLQGAMDSRLHMLRNKKTDMKTCCVAIGSLLIGIRLFFKFSFLNTALPLVAYTKKLQLNGLRENLSFLSV